MLLPAWLMFCSRHAKSELERARQKCRDPELLLTKVRPLQHCADNPAAHFPPRVIHATSLQRLSLCNNRWG